MASARVPTRYAGCPAWIARSALALLVLLVALGIAISHAGKPLAPRLTIDASQSDPALYRAVAARVATGEGYYPAVVAEQRARGYPLRPFVTVRLPTLAWLTAALGIAGAATLYKLLAFSALAALAIRLRALRAPPLERIAAMAVSALSIALLAGGGLWLWHEAWAGLLMAASLACRSRRRWVASVALGIAAASIRELAIPYLCVMALFAWREGSRREVFAWVAAAAAAIGFLAMHGYQLAGLVDAGDPASPGWTDAEGWRFVLMLARQTGAMAMLPPAATAVLLPLALVGWSALAGPLGGRATLLIAGYLAGFTLVGRPDNFYWGLLISPLLLAGLAFAPRGLLDLSRAAFSARSN